MTVAGVRARGRGYYQARLAVDGWPYEAVTSVAMEQTAADGRLRRVGLELANVTLQARADIARASLEASGFAATINDIAKEWTDAFKRPTITTQLTAALTAAATTATVADTSVFAASGVIHIGTEAISYSGKTPTTFTGLTRGIWGTVAQAHFVPDGEGLHYPQVGDRPLSLEGRRARLYLYGPGDSPLGNGTLRWLGVCATDVRYQRGVYSVTVDPITRILAQQVGGDLAESVGIRGILFPPTDPMILTIINRTHARQVQVGLAGFWETQEAFCDALTTAIASAISSTRGWSSLWASGSSISAQPEGHASYRLVYIVGTGAGAVAEIWLGGPGVRVQTGQDWRDGAGDPVPPDGVTAGGFYSVVVDARVPRVGGGGSGGILVEPGLVVVGSAGLERRIYLGGLVVPTTGMTVYLDGVDNPRPGTVLAVDAVNRYIEVEWSTSLGPETRLRFGRRLGVGTVEDLRARLATDSPGLANSGAMPLVTTTDILPSTDVVEAAAGNQLGSGRVFEAYEALELRELVEHELRALGCYQLIGSTGAIEWARLRLALPTDDATATQIDDGDLVGSPSVERSQYGMISSVVYRTGYEPFEGKHRSALIARDVQASSPNRTAQPHEVAQRSFPETRVTHAVEWWAHSPPEATIEDVTRLALPIFSAFGAPYDTWVLPLGVRFHGLLIGTVVSVTSTRIPNADTGAMGISAATGLVVGVAEDLDSGAVTAEVMVHGQRYAGYAPGVEVSGQTNVAGNVWDVDFALVGTYIRTADVRHHFRVGELVRVTQFDSAAPTEVTGTVTTETSATRLRITFDAVWTPGGSTWILRARASTSYVGSSRVAGYAFQAESTRLVDFSGATDAPARVLS